MLLPNDLDYLSKKEQYKDLIRQAEKQALARQAISQDDNPKQYQKLAGWVGNQMVKTGEKLQDYSTQPPRKAIAR
ncbi:MAG: hypothetical protein AAF485_21815 [Chloroflexota bacterium]